MMRSAGLEPLEPYPGATPPWRCRHVPCGREVKPRYSSIKRGGGPCRWCAPNAPVDPDEAAALMRSAGLEPLEPYPGTDLIWRCRCTTCGTIGTPTHGSVKLGISRAWSRRRELPRTDGDQAEVEVQGFGLARLVGAGEVVREELARSQSRSVAANPPQGLCIVLILSRWWRARGKW